MIASISIRLACCVVVLLAAGCGGGFPHVGDPPPDAQLQRWAQCMNQHGVHTIVRTSGNQGTIEGPPPPSSGQPGSDRQQMLAAHAACKQYQPNGLGANQPPSAQRLDQAAKYVQCVNQHGGRAQMTKDGGIEEQPGPGGPAAQRQADDACQSLNPDH